MKRFLAELSRIILGLTFVFSGFVKAIDPQGGAIKIGEYFTAFSWPKADSLSLSLSILLCCGEFILGALLLMGIYRRTASEVAKPRMLSFCHATDIHFYSHLIPCRAERPFCQRVSRF